MFKFAPFFSSLFGLFSALNLNARRDGADDWDPEEVRIDLREKAATEEPETPPSDDPESYRAAGHDPKRIDLREKAGTAKYRSTKRIKITRYRRRKPGVCRSITIHQTGVERAITSKRWHLVSAHYVIRSDGAILHLFDHSVRLASSNSLDRAPHHAINIEMAGNFEGVDGSGRWWSPEVMGKGRANAAQLRSLCVLLADIQAEERGRITMILPHRVSGRNRKGKPNRPICPGSRVWKCAEAWAMRNGLEVPGEGVKFGGDSIQDSWRSDAWKAAQG